MKKKNIISLLISIVILIIALILSGYLWLLNQMQQKVIFFNDSSYGINSVKINFSGKELTLNDIQPQSIIHENIVANSDSAFGVKIIFSDNFIIEESNLGYITNGDGSDNIFLITEDRKLIFDQEH